MGLGVNKKASGEHGDPSKVQSITKRNLTTRVEAGNVTDEGGSGGHGLTDNGADGRGTSRGQNSSSDGLTLADEGVVPGLEGGGSKTILDSGGEGSTVNDGRAAGEGGDNGSERRHLGGNRLEVTDFRRGLKL